MKLLNSRYAPTSQLNASRPSMRLMCGGSEKEIELVRKKLFEAGITSETRRHPMAASLGVSGLELWVQNERDLFNASRLYTRLQQESAISQEPPTETPKAGTFGAAAHQKRSAGLTLPRSATIAWNCRKPVRCCRKASKRSWCAKES
jgi:hypothetical protein